ncbi:hypothetical protein SODALDRAFT_363158 [Sodiomyces alkalinus F11]|uniref:Uncharacterized protein n=1 Tax=Sodiomyces alkalinus (strain CBS 110278 / VKM F-3762 / F11) TaxID=1314773 RepID=A0A3N2PLP8_SODAK|nr:hypothetical protein SODALDRAFT_363158 [Sodiomyces alkalinus F11]ROT35340.1 hypothetical protein SODALDRAFT_363158 [Sodiomyces alkalinus F11]
MSGLLILSSLARRSSRARALKHNVLEVGNILQFGDECRKQIKDCGATIHYMPFENPTNFDGWVVCKPCPIHGRTGSEADYSSYPVVDMDLEGNLAIIQRGLDHGPQEEDMEASGLDVDISQLTLEGEKGDSTDPIKVDVHSREGRIRFNHGGETFKKKPESWSVFTNDDGEVHHIFERRGKISSGHSTHRHNPPEPASRCGQSATSSACGTTDDHNESDGEQTTSFPALDALVSLGHIGC